MKVSGFTFIRNGVDLGYPFVPSIRSLLPLCDEIIVNVPRSTDSTLKMVKALGDPKIRIIETEWDEKLRKDGLALSHHTNLALKECAGDWCVYMQGDEVLHEDSVPTMRAAMEQELNSSAVQGLLVDYTHFYGSYQTYVYSLGWYYQEVRVVRRDPNIRSCGDAQGFRTVDGQKLHVKKSGGRYFHYGHALKPDLAERKLRNLSGLYHDDVGVKEEVGRRPPRFYDDDQKVKPFTGAHPAVMRDTVAAADWTYTSRNPLIRFRRDYFWEDVALLIKRCTGLTLGVHRNYRFVKD
ncbi:MAG TPA: glycosyltransferase [Candidatus Angelobacter sp.]|nr:glycosyltransferase [Candidatus Angelobacter sp.]